MLTVGLVTFVFATILGWAYYGEKAAEYLFGVGAVRPYRVLWVLAVMVGSVVSLPAVWSFADIANGLMGSRTSLPSRNDRARGGGRDAKRPPLGTSDSGGAARASRGGEGGV